MKITDRLKSQNFLVGVVFATFAAMFVMSVLSFFHVTEVTSKVTKAERVYSKHDNSFRVFTEEGVFTIESSIFMMRLNNENLYSSIRVGDTYRITSRGWRIDFLGIFPNIEMVTRVEDNR